MRPSPDFHRFKLTRGDDREIIDVVVDRAAQVDALKASVDGIRVDTLCEILANTMTTLGPPNNQRTITASLFVQKIQPVKRWP